MALFLLIETINPNEFRVANGPVQLSRSLKYEISILNDAVS